MTWLKQFWNGLKREMGVITKFYADVLGPGVDVIATRTVV
jgi:hypothetical protein